jgi:hypothetical protein
LVDFVRGAIHPQSEPMLKSLTFDPSHQVDQMQQQRSGAFIVMLSLGNKGKGEEGCIIIILENTNY